MSTIEFNILQYISKANQATLEDILENVSGATTDQVIMMLKTKRIIRSMLDSSFFELPASSSVLLAQEQETRKIESKERRRETVRYVITTIIALAALVKSFWPELRGLLASLLMR